MILSIDLETYSETDLGTCGVYRYVEDPHWEILLIGYAIDNDPVTVIDLVKKVNMDNLPAFKAMLDDPAITKTAYNAQFEITNLSRWIGHRLDPAQWQDTMVWAAYCGLPRKLKEVGEALGFGADKKKLAEGSALVRYFCQPCNPTKSNGGRTRNMPDDAPEKWDLFIEYNRQDVVAERAIRQMIEPYKPPESEHEAWVLDQQINARGVLCDRKLASEAVAIATEHTDKLLAEMKEITHLENPNSTMQLSQWLGMKNVTKETVAEELKTATGDRKRVLELRQESNKSSVKKYIAMQNYMCSDDRCRGLFQFYGANRSGRFAGRGIQLQNLPQNHITDLEEARQLVREGDYETLQMLYGDTNDILSQCIRTAFIPKPDCTFAVADFSAIEARVIAWLADEKWRMELFANGGDIYCQSASRMFGIPVVKRGINGEYRSRGKIAELACIAEGELVLTDKGLVPIQDVTTDMNLWDGENWVTHEGVIYKGERNVITYEGLTATPDHLVWVEGKPWPIRFGDAPSSGSHLLQAGNGRSAIRVGEDHQPGKTMERVHEPMLCTDAMHGMRKDSVDGSRKSATGNIERLSGLFAAKADSKVAGQETDSSQAKMHKSERPSLQVLRREGDQIRVRQCSGSRTLDDRESGASEEEHGDRQDRHERQLRSWKSEMGNAQGERQESETDNSLRVRPAVLALCEDGRGEDACLRDDQGRDYRGCESGSVRKAEELERHKGKVKVYDIRNAGPRHRFTVSNTLVHNCGYGGSVGAMVNMGAVKLGLTEEECLDIVTRWREASPHIVDLWWDVDEKVKRVLQYGTVEKLRHGVEFWKTKNLLHIKLPSGRCLRYYRPKIVAGKFGKDVIEYQSYDMGKWGKAESYGPKFVENIIQGIARDCLIESMQRVVKRYPDIVMHVHDEMIVEVPSHEAQEALNFICSEMGRPIPWAPGLLLRGDGYLCDFYKKD